MPTKATIWFAATCLIVIVQATSAWEPKLCEGSKGELISFDIANCPDKSGDYCKLNVEDPVIYRIKFKSGKIFGASPPFALLIKSNYYGLRHRKFADQMFFSQ